MIVRGTLRLAVISVHGCPLLNPGSRESGGMNVYVAKVGQELADRGVHVDVFTRWHDEGAPQVVALHPNLRIVHLEAAGRGPRPKEDLFPLLPEFQENLERFRDREGLRYDIIHSHYWLSGWVGAALKERWGVPHAVMFHTLGRVKNQARAGEREPEVRIEAERDVMERADAVVVATSPEAQQLARLYQAAQDKVRVIPCGVDLELFRPFDREAARQRLGLNGERILLFVGRPDPFKGLEILISAASQLEHPAGVRVLVVGGEGADAPGFQGPRSLAHELAIGDQVSFLGSVAHQLLPYYYNAADVCVIPSYHESFGLVALEAMACGTPVVASRVGGLQSTVRDGETGFLIPWHCPEPFAERLELMLGNETLRASLGAAAQVAAQRYRWSEVAEHLLDLYQSLAAHQSEGP